MLRRTHTLSCAHSAKMGVEGFILFAGEIATGFLIKYIVIP